MALTLAQRFSIKRFIRGEGPTSSPVTLSHRRIFIFPNRAGFAMAGVLLLMLVAAINYNNSMGFVFTFLLASAAQLSTHYSFRNLSGLQLRAATASNVFMGESACFHVRLVNPLNRARFAITIKAKNHHAVTAVHSLPQQQEEWCSLRVPTKTRGWLTLGSVTYSSTFPLGIFRAWSPVDLDQRLLVYPKPAENAPPLPLKAPSVHETNQIGTESGADHFEGMRPYQYPDSFRHINWRVWARQNSLYVNQFSAGQSPKLWLDWNQCGHVDIERRLSILCRWVLDAESQGIQYGLKLPGQKFSPARGETHQQACLKALALYGQEHAPL